MPKFFLKKYFFSSFHVLSGSRFAGFFWTEKTTFAEGFQKNDLDIRDHSREGAEDLAGNCVLKIVIWEGCSTEFVVANIDLRRRRLS